MNSPRGPVAAGRRALGPDLARGVMLLCIALANSHYFVRGDAHLAGFPLDGGSVDRAVAWVIATFVDGRAFPMFGLLFGYGVALLVGRNTDAGRPATRGLLWRRAAVLVVVGVVDGFLFYAGDILAMYGVLLLLGSFAVFWRDRWLLAVAALFFLVTSLPDAGVYGTEGPDPVLLPPDPVTMLTDRAAAVALVSLVGPIGFAAPFLVGLWAGRRRMLERGGRHRGLLVTTAVVGPVIAVLGAQPLALAVAGAVPVPPVQDQAALGALHGASGVAGGFGYAALIALVALRIERRPVPGPVVTALASAGKRSMTGYLAQSPVWAVVFTPFLLDLSGTLSVTSTALLATGVWLATVVLADSMRRAGRRGPFETLVRRVTYGPEPGAEPKAGQGAELGGV